MTSSSAKKSSSTRMWREKKRPKYERTGLERTIVLYTYVFEVQGSSDTFFKWFNAWF